MGKRNPVVVPKKLVVFDLMGTLLWGPKGHREHLVDIYRQVGGLQGVLKRNIEQTVLKVRGRLDHETIPPNMYWPFVNSMILRELDPTQFGGQTLVQLAALGEEIHRLYLSEHRLYRVDPNMRWLLTYLRNSGVPMCIGSNQDVGVADELIERFSLLEYFPREGIFVSERLEAHKPQLAFIRKIAELYHLSPEEMIHVGNSVNSDVPLVKSGCTVVLLDPDGRHSHHHSWSRRILRKHGEYLESGQLRVQRSVRKLAIWLERHVSRDVRLVHS